MEYSKQQIAYIKSVDGAAHMSAVEIIGKLEAKNERLKEALENYGQHKIDCLRSKWEQYSPDRGYKYAGKWYDKHEDVKCTCGFEQALEGGE